MSPLPRHQRTLPHHGYRHPATDSRPASSRTNPPTAATVRPLADPVTGQYRYTPGEAAIKLRVTESWLRKKAARRLIPRTFVGRLLRFSVSDVETIAAGTLPIVRRERSIDLI